MQTSIAKTLTTSHIYACQPCDPAAQQSFCPLQTSWVQGPKPWQLHCNRLHWRLLQLMCMVSTTTVLVMHVLLQYTTKCSTQTPCTSLILKDQLNTESELVKPLQAIIKGSFKPRMYAFALSGLLCLSMHEFDLSKAAFPGVVPCRRAVRKG